MVPARLWSTGARSGYPRCPPPRRSAYAIAMDAQIGRLFLDRARYLLLTEYRTKIRLAVEALPEDALWWRPNDQSNSVGNLLLHLAGNVRQWMVSGVGTAPDIRHRAAEFAPVRPRPMFDTARRPDRRTVSNIGRGRTG